MQEVNDLHDKAMELADDADVARRRGKVEEAQLLYRQAYELEVKVARQTNVEPSRSVMYRSAAALALECNLLDEARTMALTGMGGQPPGEIASELQEIIAEVDARQGKPASSAGNQKTTLSMESQAKRLQSQKRGEGNSLGDKGIGGTSSMSNKALVVDDNFYNRDIARLALENAGYHVSEAENGIEALEMLDREAYALLILDLAMPELDGIGVIDEIRKHSQHNHMKIVIVTAHSHMTGGAEMIADFVMFKPIDITSFMTFLKRLQQSEQKKPGKNS